VVRIGAAVPLRSGLRWSAASDHAGEPQEATTGFATRAAEDLALAASMGLQDIRVPFDWARIERRPGAFDGSAVEWYTELVEAAARAGVRLWAALLEGPLPQWVANGGGLAEPGTRRALARFADGVAERWGDRLGGWVPLVDPTGVARAGYLAGTAPPHQQDPERHAAVLRELALAWRDLWLALHGGPPVATALGVEVVRATDHTIPAQAAAREQDRQQWAVWLGALREGELAVPGLATLEVPALLGACDVLGAVLTAPSTIDADRWRDDAGSIVHRLAEQGPARPAHITMRVPGGDESSKADMVEATLDATQEAAVDGVPVELVWLEPFAGLVLNRDREPTSVTAVVQRFVRT